ncbi:MAG: type II secretion system protein [Candidatus Gastranaerophilaceae bacterium]
MYFEIYDSKYCHCERSEAIQKATIALFGLLRRFTPRNDRGVLEGLEALKVALLPRNDENKPKAAFTLAEVLLTLTIIGIIAAMTIPSLMNSTNKMENVVALKKAYSTLSQAYLMVTADNGGDITSALSGVATYDDFANIFIQKLNVAKNCGTASAKATGCFPNVTFKNLNGTDAALNLATTNSSSTILTNDGMSYYFQVWDTSCNTDISNPTGTTSSPFFNTCGEIWVDINGPNKGPFVMGRDLFQLFLTKKGLYPVGAYPDIWNNECSAGGGACANKVLLEGAMNY